MTARDPRWTAIRRGFFYILLKMKKKTLQQLNELSQDKVADEALRRLNRIEEVIDKGYMGVALRDYVVRALEGKIKERATIKFSDKQLGKS